MTPPTTHRSRSPERWKRAVNLCLGVALLALVPIAPAVAKAADKPNIIVIWGDDIGQSNLSTYTDGLMGYHTPNIDRIANEGMKFTDYYAEQSCTAWHEVH